MNFIIKVLKALLSRLVFFTHGMVSVYLLYRSTLNRNYWILVVPLILLLCESLVTITWINRSGYKYFWPSGFLYITTIVPIIWITELNLLEKRVDECIKHTVYESGLTQTDIKAEYFGFHVSTRIVGKKVCELGMAIGLILGRWLIPSGHMSREQLSGLLLGYVGNAADTLEFIQSAEIKRVACIRSVTIAVLLVYTWSIYQFSLVTTATMKNEDDIEKSPKKRNKISPLEVIPGSRKNTKEKKKYIDVRVSTINKKEKRGKNNHLHPVLPVSPYLLHSMQPDESDIKLREMHGEMFQILVTMVMQDGPFLVLRLYLLIYYGIDSEMHIFFTCKNAVIVLLLVYRLLILNCSGQDEEIAVIREEAAAKLRNTQQAIKDELISAKDRECILVL